MYNRTWIVEKGLKKMRNKLDDVKKKDSER